MEDLPSSYDLIVVGTGMPECILAAAAARVGKTVLHIDRNTYYGGDWASFNFDQLQRWIEENKPYDQNSSPVDGTVDARWSELLAEGEQLVACPKRFPFITNVKEELFVKEKPEVINEQSQEDIISENVKNLTVGNFSGASEDSTAGEKIREVCDAGEACPEGSVCGTDNCNENITASSACESQSEAHPDVAASAVSGEQKVNSEDATVCKAANIPSTGAESEMTSVLESGSEGSIASCEDVAAGCDAESSSKPRDKEKDTVSPKKEWTLEDLKAQHRKFNLDLAPKLLFARGPLVELLISSNIARYAEFKCFTRVLTSINGHLEQVPCSRADVFSTKNVSVVEKRMLMKLLTFCLEYQKHPEEYRGFEGRPFLRFLRSKKLTPNIEHYVLHAIAMVDESTPTLQGLQATQKFLESLGRYGNSPFLWTCYGSAELPQCFCRLCAVFGGIYYLNRDPQAVVLDSERKCRGIISQGQKLSCEWLVVESSYAPLEFLPEESPERISRAILITDSSLLAAEKEQITLLRLPPVPGVRGAITVFELGPAAYVSPNGLYVVHMACRSAATSASEDLKPAIQELFQPSEGDENQDEKEMLKPKVLWAVFFNQRDTSLLNLNTNVPSGMLLTSSPGLEQDYEEAVKEAQELFSKICPDEGFLPRAPDPEDIVLEDQSNPGEAGENQLPDACDGEVGNGDIPETSESLEEGTSCDDVELSEKALGSEGEVKDET